MTALRKYAKLEATGLWRPQPDAQRREVVVAFGEASLVLSDGPSDLALSHWSLPAVQRRNPGEVPALYAPSPDPAAETLELDEPAMIDAIETVRAALARRRPRRGRLRLAVMGGTFAALALLAMTWLPNALVEHTAQVVPFVKRQQIGQDLLSAMSRFTGAPCASPAALEPLERLKTRLFNDDGTRIVVLRDGLAAKGTLHLPGRLVLVDRRLLEANDGPEVLAGHLLAERMRADAVDPLLEILRAVGLRATLTLLATGSLPEGALEAQARERLQTPGAALDADVLLARFATARVPATPYALALDPTGRSTLALIEADPVPPAKAEPLMPDVDWLALQAICAR